MIDPNYFPKDNKYFRNTGFLSMSIFAIIIVGTVVGLNIYRNSKIQIENENSIKIRNRIISKLASDLKVAQIQNSPAIKSNGIRLGFKGYNTQIALAGNITLNEKYQVVAAFKISEVFREQIFIINIIIKDVNVSFQNDVDKLIFFNIDKYIKRKFTRTEFNSNGFKINITIGYDDQYYLYGLLENENIIMNIYSIYQEIPSDEDIESLWKILQGANKY